MQQTLTVGPVTFGQFVFRLHKDMLVIAGLGMISLFTIYKIVYLYPDFYFDSYHYISLAHDSKFLSVWPMGYSYFLRAVHALSVSPLLLVIVQYLLLQLSSFWLAFSLFYYFQPPHWVKATVVTFLVVNPLYLYLANLVSSDVLFTALSIAWITLLIHMVYNARMWHALLQGPLLAYLFMIRYQAAYYPLVMIVALWMAEFNVLWKIISAGIAFFLLGWIVRSTIKDNTEKFGQATFSAQSGWILATNAMFMYPHITVDTSLYTGTALQPIHRYVDSFLTKRGLMQHNYTPWDGPRFMLRDEVMWNYLGRVYIKDYQKDMYWYYNRLGKEWQQYGQSLISHHPWAYFRYYLLPNAGVYLFPKLEQFERYNMGIDQVPGNVMRWFGWPGNVGIESKWKEGSGYMLWIFKPLNLLLNLALLVALWMILFQKRYRLIPVVFRKVLGLMAVSFAGNALLLIVAAPVMLRYQAYGFVLGLILLLMAMPLLLFKMKQPAPITTS